jgi:hypothetical protein
MQSSIPQCGSAKYCTVFAIQESHPLARLPLMRDKQLQKLIGEGTRWEILVACDPRATSRYAPPYATPLLSLIMLGSADTPWDVSVYVLP